MEETDTMAIGKGQGTFAKGVDLKLDWM